VFLWIDDQEVQFLDASELWGLTTRETVRVIREQLNDQDVQVLSIGPAGENLVKNACIIIDRFRAAGRCGMGAVMGSKNLKAIAVRGSGSIRVADSARFMKAVEHTLKKIHKSQWPMRHKAHGTLGSIPPLVEVGLMPYRNFQDDYLEPSALKNVSHEVFEEWYEVKRIGYSACPISCSHVYRVLEGPYQGSSAEGVEANNIWNFTGRLGITDPAAIIRAHQLCSEYGLDQDNATGSIAWAMECFERGILNQEDTDGLQLKWGDHGLVMELLRKMALREGFGDLIGEGSKRAADLLGRGSQRYAVHIKGQDSIEPMRGAKGWALGLVVSPRGGAHTSGANLAEVSFRDLPSEECQRIFGVPRITGPESYEHKSAMLFFYEKFQSVINSINICMFVTLWKGPDLIDPEDVAELFSSATGIELDAEEVLRVGERISNLEKAFNILHAGFSREDDYPPPRFMEDAVQSGPMKGEILRRKDWDRMLDEYYALHGWNGKTGWPTRKRLERLGLENVARDLDEAGKLMN
jgi:aldehyde:ferredoxin oxidoreductase